MARSKHSAALFEVIVPTKSLSQQRRPGMFRSITGWLRSRPRSGVAGGGGERHVEISLPTPEPVYEPPPMPRRISMPEPLAISYESPSVDELPSGGGGGRSRRELALRLNFTTAMILVLGVGTVVGAAFIAGRRMVLGPKPLIAPQSSEALRMNPPTPEVTQVLPRTTVQVGNGGGGNAPRNVAPRQPQPKAPASAVIRGLPRRKKVNYVIIQSYPLQEKHMADEARALLVRSGVECTIEKDLWKGWYSVVGTDGFETISKNPALNQYISRVKQISEEAHAKKRTFKSFSPMPILWK